MFTGIIETLGKVIQIEEKGTNRHFTVASPISAKLKIDQSVSHNGVCLTVVAKSKGTHAVTAIAETLERTNLGALKIGATINLERAMKSNALLDGHIVQGHVDATGEVIGLEDKNGSWFITFAYAPTPEVLLVDKGSVCVNGVSLTVVNPTKTQFSVAIIPYTWENTMFHALKIGDSINIEFDIIGKYIAKHAAMYFAANKVS
jgi:riboflavin synthase